MDNLHILVISLRGFLLTGEKLLENLDDSQLAFEYLDNSNKIRKYIFDNFYHNSILREFYLDLPKVHPELSGQISETILEKIMNSSQRIRTLVELFGMTLSPEKENQRAELMNLISNNNQKTRTVLQQLSGAI